MPARCDTSSWAGLFGPEVSLLATSLDHSLDALHPQERVQVERAVPKRQHEYAAGRWCAHTLLSELGFDDAPLLAGPSRAPLWPTGAVGSISHCRTLCAAAVTRREHHASVGLDIEDQTPLEESLWRIIARPDELAWLTAQTPSCPSGVKAKLLFSAKESFYKCQHPLTSRLLEFGDVRLEFDHDAGCFQAWTPSAELRSLAGSLRGRFLLTGQHIVTAMAASA